MEKTIEDLEKDIQKLKSNHSDILDKKSKEIETLNAKIKDMEKVSIIKEQLSAFKPKYHKQLLNQLKGSEDINDDVKQLKKEFPEFLNITTKSPTEAPKKQKNIREELYNGN